jgi:hypothetical protein
MGSDSARGELHVGTRETFEPYAREWIRTYTGRTSRGFRESTREEADARSTTTRFRSSGACA